MVDKIIKDQKVIKQIIDYMAESSVSPKKFKQLKTLMGALAENSISRDYIDATLNEQAMKRLNDLLEISATIQDIKNKGSSFEKRLIKFQAFIKEMKKRTRLGNSVADEEIKKLQISMKAMQDENNTYKKGSKK